MSKPKLKPTPGPWYWQEIPGETLMHHERACISRGSGKPYEDGEIVAVSRLEDARLIAATPDLLRVIERFAKAMKQKSYPELQGIACEAFQALAKATGREP